MPLSRPPPPPSDPCYLRLATTDLGRLRTRPLAGTRYRTVQIRHLSTALQVRHSRSIASRFNAGHSEPRPFTISYLAENHLVAMLEVQALLGSPTGYPGILPVPALSWATLNVQVDLQRVVDLCDIGETNELDVSAQELTGDWRGYDYRRVLGTCPLPTGRAPTQQLGGALKWHLRADGDYSFEAFLVPSARLPYHRNLVIFPQNLLPTSSVTWANPITGLPEAVDRT